MQGAAARLDRGHEGEGDQEPGLEPGDVYIVLDQKEHPVFHRQDDNLIMKMNIKLVEALCGFKKTIQTLDNRTIVITSQPGNSLNSAGFHCWHDRHFGSEVSHLVINIFPF